MDDDTHIGRLVVLVVEDEPLLRFMAVDMVEDAGFAAVEAASSLEAVHVLETRPDIRILFTDIDMPLGIDGVRLAALVRDRWPPIAIIITSGQRAHEVDTIPAGCEFFSKPYQHDRVIATMRRMVA